MNVEAIKIEKSTKNLGVAGATLAMFGVFIPLIGALLSLVGHVMHLIFYYRVSQEIGDKKIFKYMLYFYILIAVAVTSAVFAAFSFLTSMYYSIENQMMASGMDMSLMYNSISAEVLSSQLLIGLVAIAILTSITGYIFFVMATKRLSNATLESLIFAGAVLSIIPVVNIIGAIIYFIGLLKLPSKS